MQDPDSLYVCPECGYRMLYQQRYNSEHLEYHDHYVAIESKYGLCLKHNEREALKLGASRLMTGSTNTEVKKFAFLLRMYSHFMRSLMSYEDMEEHPSFEDYVAMILKDEHYGESHKDIADMLRRDIGVKDGIREGSTYYGV